MSAAGQNTNVWLTLQWFRKCFTYKAECTIEVETFVALIHSHHIEALRITGSVDLMTNINPEGAISIMHRLINISGSFNKGFEFSGDVRSLGAWSQGECFTGVYSHTYGRPGYGDTGTRDVLSYRVGGIYTGPCY